MRRVKGGVSLTDGFARLISGAAREEQYFPKDTRNTCVSLS